MPGRDRRIDLYLQEAPEHARPILARLRAAVHTGCPDVEETMKWSRPFFERGGPFCHMAAYEKHCSFGFWKPELVLEGGKTGWKEAMDGLARLTSVDDLPRPGELERMVKVAARLAEHRADAPRAKPASRKAFPAPPELSEALARDARARAAYEAFSPSCKREYHEWIADAKRPETRARRLAQALEWMRAGKTRNWKYR